MPDEDLHTWFARLCEKRRGLWESRIAELEIASDPTRSRKVLEEKFAANAKTDLERLDTEVNLMVVRTAAILTAATVLVTVLVAVYALKPTDKLFLVFLAIGLCLAVCGFVTALMPLAPPFWRAWKKPYEKRHEWTLLKHDHFTSWALDCWAADRRTPVIQRYKKAHAVVIPILMLAALTPAAGVVVNVFA